MAKKRETGEDILKAIMEKGGKSASFKVRDEPAEQASFGAQIKSSIVPKLESISKLEQIQQPTPSVEAQSQAETGKKGVLDNILNYSKVSSDNSTQLVSLTKDIKTLNEKSIEDNKELFERLLKSNEALRTSMEESMRESSRAGKGGGGGGGAGPSEGGGNKDEGGGIPDWLKAAAGVAAGGLGAKVLGGASKMMGAKTATKGMAGLKGFGKGALKGGLLGAMGLAGYAMSSEDLKEKLGEYGIDENTVAAAGVAGTAGYAAYKAVKGVEGVNEAIKQKKIENIESGKQGERTAEAKEAKKQSMAAEPKAEAPKVEPKVEAPKTDPTKSAAEAAKGSVAKEAGETVGKKATKTAGIDAIKKAIAKVGSSKTVATIAKKLPFVGVLAGLWFATGRAMAGDYKGAGAEALSGVAGATGVGAVPSLAIDVGLMARDVYKELYDVFPEDDDSGLVQERMGEIQTAVTDYVKSLVPQKDESKTEEMKPLDELSGPQNEPPPSPEPTETKSLTDRAVGALVDNRGLNDAKEGEVMPTQSLSSSRNVEMSSQAGREEQVDKATTNEYINSSKTVAGSEMLGRFLTKEGGVSEQFMGTQTSSEKDKFDHKEMFAQRISGGLFGFDKFKIHSGNESVDVDRGEYATVQKLLSEGKQEEAFKVFQKVKNAKNQMPEYDAAGNVVGVNPEGKLDAVKSMETKAGVLAEAPAQPSGAPIIVNKGGDTVNNITNASGGGSGGAPGTPSRVPNPWDNQVFGQPWAAYP